MKAKQIWPGECRGAEKTGHPETRVLCLLSLKGDGQTENSFNTVYSVSEEAVKGKRPRALAPPSLIPLLTLSDGDRSGKGCREVLIRQSSAEQGWALGPHFVSKHQQIAQ